MFSLCNECQKLSWQLENKLVLILTCFQFYRLVKPYIQERIKYRNVVKLPSFKKECIIIQYYIIFNH